ncbi:dTMP kinase [Aphanothece sacrum]|uniref:Thymidylate kinase n=1 Tax=Aphanothece sacrum FPU1 TaxID=1920663 RepID=A0A401II87_APHSA|nr:dTMP kinase [Aphanothece sacrum]GBF80974.1 thymidylate kinase [Aphanothece sacrum FPU1]GBF85281.1 thymidylate kinase [Aphanothece sacrum FPU3]
MKPLFIVLEGIDKAGKSTQAELLKSYFINQGNAAIISSEPTDGPIGKLIRNAMQNQIITIQDKAKFDEQMAYLFTADRYYHLYNDIDGVYQLIKHQKTHVIATRYYFSSLAYNCNNQEEFDFVYGLNKRFPNPDLVIYIDISLELALSRISNYSLKEVYETQEKLNKVRENYSKVFQSYEGNILRLEGEQTVDNIHKKIINYLEKKVF